MNSAKELNQQIDEIIAFIEKRTSLKPELGISISCSLMDVANNIENPVVIPYTEIPHLPSDPNAYTVGGNLIIGQLCGKNIIAMQGRLMLFDGHTPQTVSLLIRVMNKMGAKTLVIISTAGGLNYHFRIGEIMLITDHVNFTGYTPLRGENLDDFGPRFCNMWDIYDIGLQNIVRSIATENKIQLCQGVYAGILGPQFATRAELKIYMENDCDAVGMSVIPEAIVAAHCGMKILGMALISDMALPYSTKQATMQEIADQAKESGSRMETLMLETVRAIKI